MWCHAARLRGLLGLGLCASGAAGLSLSAGRADVDLDNEAVGAAGTAVLAGLQIGSFEGAADVAANGVVLPGWTPDAPAGIGPADARTRLWAMLADPDASPAPVAELSMLSADTSVVSATITRVGGTGNTVGGVLQPLVVDVAYECHRAGTASLMALLRFADARLAPMQLSLQKACAARPRRGLALGTTSQRVGDVLRDGTSQWTTATATQRLVPASTDHVDLYWALSATGGAEDSAVQFIAPPRAVVTPLGSGGVPLSGPPVTEIRRWRRLLLIQADRERRGHGSGGWALPPDEDPSRAAGSHPMVRVRFTGALSAGGELPTEAEEPPEGTPRPALGVHLDCFQEGSALVQVEVAPYPPFQPYRPSVVSFVKQCGGTMSSGFEASTRPISSDAAADLLKGGQVIGTMQDVSNLESQAAVYWRSSMGAPDASRVTCNSTLVRATLARPSPAAFGGAAPSGRQDVNFRCHGEGAALCSVRFAWRLVEGPKVQIVKHCGGSFGDVDIESDLPDAPLVLLAGGVQRAWAEESPQVTLPPEDDKATFTVTLDRDLKPGEQALRISPPQLRVFRPDVVKAHLIGDMISGGTVSGSSDSADVQVAMECLMSGTSRIEVILPVGDGGGDFKPLKFAYEKRCVVVAYFQQWWFVAVACFAGAFCLSSTVLLICVYRFQSQLTEELKKKGGPAKPAREMQARGESDETE